MLPHCIVWHCNCRCESTKQNFEEGSRVACSLSDAEACPDIKLEPCIHGRTDQSLTPDHARNGCAGASPTLIMALGAEAPPLPPFTDLK